MAYRRTYRDLETPWGSELDFDLEFTDSEIYQAMEAILDKEEEAYQLKRKLKAHIRGTPVLGIILTDIERELGDISDLFAKILVEEIDETHKEVCARVKLLRDPLIANLKNASMWHQPGHFVDIPNSPEYLQTLYKFSEGIKASGASYEFCPHPDRVMVRYYSPDDAKKAEEFLKKAGFKFWAESDG